MFTLQNQKPSGSVSLKVDSKTKKDDSLVKCQPSPQAQTKAYRKSYKRVSRDNFKETLEELSFPGDAEILATPI